jgi:hypothetical protein
VSDKDVPEIPSFEELGMSAEEVEELERDLAGKGVPPPAKAPAPPGEVPPPGKGPPPPREPGQAAAARPPHPAPPGANPPAAGRVRPPRPPAGPLAWLAPLLLVGLAWFSSSSRIAPPPALANAPATAFSAARAQQHLERIARRPHPPGSPEHAAVRAYLLDELEDLGHAPEVQTATSVIGRGDVARAATVRNVVARVPGSDDGGAVLITAHYDGRGISRAAGDDGVGVAVILEALRALRAGSPVRNDVIVLFTDAEELGLLGARAFVDEHTWLADVALVLSLEMRGAGGPALMFETAPENGWVVAALRDAVARPAANSLSYEIYQRLPNDTDFTPFMEAGKQGLNFAAIGDAHVYHQAYDAPANVSASTVQHHGDQALALLRHLGDADLAAVNAPDVVYFSTPLLGLVAYARVWVWAYGALVVLAWLLVVWWARKRGARAWAVAAGATTGAASLAASAAVGYGLFAWRRAAHPEFGALHGSAFHSEGWYVLALAAAALAIAGALFGLIRRWCTPAELFAGAAVLPVAGAAAATVLLPLGAANLQWPALAGCVAAASLVSVGAEGRFGAVRWSVAAAAALVALVFLVPLIELLWLALSLAAAPILGAVLGLLALLMLPALEPSRAPNVWWLPAAALVVAGAFLALGVATATPSPERPAPSTLLYAADRTEGSAAWATDGGRPADDPGVVWASSRVGGFGETGSLRRFTFGDRPYALAPAPMTDAPAPAVGATFDSAATAPTVRVEVRSLLGAEGLLFDLPAGGPSLRSVNGEPVPNAEPPSRVEHWGAPEAGVVLEFTRGFRDEVLAFAVVEHLLRPEELVGREPFERPDGLAPDITRLSDRAMIRTAVRIDLATGAVDVGPAAGRGPAGGSAPAGVGGPVDRGGPRTEPDSAKGAASLVDSVPPAPAETPLP